MFRPALMATGMLIFASDPAVAWCNMDDYNQNDPPSPISDVIDAYSDLKLEWGSDVDEYQKGERAWHYVRNLHKQGVSVNWPKTGILIPFGNALPQGKVHCQKHYDERKNAFIRDDDAPMRINSYPSSPAVAYVRRSGPVVEPSESTRIETGYIYKGKEISAFVEVSFYYFPGEPYVKMAVTYDPPEMGVIFSNESLNFKENTLADFASGGTFKAGQLRDLIEVKSLPTGALRSILTDESFMVQGIGKNLVGFDTRDSVASVIPILLIDPEGRLIAAGQVPFEGAVGLRKQR